MTLVRWLGSIGGGAAIVVLMAAGDARAQSSTDKAAAETLFEEGRKLMAEGHHAEACPKFASSQKLDPGLGTLLNLGNCYELTGKLASAWAQFREAASLASASGDTRRAEAAQKRASDLEPRLARVTIAVPATSPANLEVELDGVAYDRAVVNVAMPIDPGAHEISVKAPGHAVWTTRLQVPEEAAQLTVEVPALQPLATRADGGTRPTPAVVPGPVTTPPDTGGGARRWSGQRTAALISGGLGLVAAGCSVAFGLRARADWNDAQGRCPDGVCASQRDVELGDDARTNANVATVLGGLGLAGIAAGAVLWITAPTGAGRAGYVGLGAGPGASTGLSVRGGF